MYSELCSVAKRNLYFDNSKINLEIDIFPCFTYAYYLYQGKDIIEKIPYSSSSKVVFESVPLENKSYRVKVFYRWNEYKFSIFTDTLKFFKKSFKLSFSESLLDNLALFEIRLCRKPTVEILNTERRGFIAFGRKDLPPYLYKYPIGWLDNPYEDRNWLFQFQAWRMLDAYLERFSLSDVKVISAIINDWISFEKKNDDKWLWYDMSTGLRALKITYFLYKTKKMNIHHGIEDIEYLLREHLIHLSNIKELSTGNHALFQLNGLMALLFIIDKIDGISLQESYNFAIQNMTALLIKQMGLYGVHTEDSPDYHFFVKKKIQNILKAPWWQKADTFEIEALLEESNKADAWLLDPLGCCIPIGDSTTSKKDSDVSLAKLWPHIALEDSIGANLDGYSIVRSPFESDADDTFYLLLQGSFYSGAHKHSDCLSILWQEKGEYILIDSGKYGYQKDNFRKYFLSSQAHNTVTIDNCSFSRKGKDAYGSAITIDPMIVSGYWITQGIVKHKEGNYSHKRTVVYKTKEEMYVIDEIISCNNSKNRLCDINWHVEPWTDVQILNDNILLHAVNNKVELLTSFVCDGKFKDSQKKIFRGQTKPFYAGLASKKYLESEDTTTIRISGIFDNSMLVLSEFILDTAIKQDNRFIYLNSDSELSCDDKLILDMIKKW